jgi:hypothetical protein
MPLGRHAKTVHWGRVKFGALLNRPRYRSLIAVARKIRKTDANDNEDEHDYGVPYPPTIKRTISSGLVSEVSTSPTFVPLRNTIIRSLT